MNYNLLNFCECDKYAIKSYCAVHNEDENKNLGDITQINIGKLPTDVDFITTGSPCQSFSISGKQEGGAKGSGTKSSLMWHNIEIIKHCKPKFVLWENVKNILSKRHKPVFDEYLLEMKKSGYNSYYAVLNAKNYGIPQNRERMYCISVREDIDNNPDYDIKLADNSCYEYNLFPKPFELKLHAKDLLEDRVDEKHYLSEKGLKGFIVRNNQRKNNFKFEPVIPDECDVLHTLTTEMYRATSNWIDETEVSIRQLGNMSGANCKNPSWGRIYDEEGLCPTLTSMVGGRREPLFLVKEATNKGYKEAYEGDSINLEFPNSKTRRGRVGDGALQTLTTQPHQDVVCSPPPRIRKLTPKECWRAMGFGDEDFEKASKAKIGNRTMSDHQLYRQAGNSIVVDVLYYIYKMIQNKYPDDFKEGMKVISLFSGIGAFEKALERL